MYIVLTENTMYDQVHSVLFQMSVCLTVRDFNVQEYMYCIVYVSKFVIVSELRLLLYIAFTVFYLKVTI